MESRSRIMPDDEYNRILTGNVHPSAWVNPVPASRYHLVVIGAGTAGLVAAASAVGLGARVALIERHLFGGDCLNAGCVPSKALIRAGRAAYDVRTAHRFGTGPAAGSINFAAAMERMRKLRSELSRQDSVERFSRELGVDVFLGSARFSGRNAVQVDDAVLRFGKAVICTGSRPAIPDVPGLREAGFLTNETVFELTRLPVSIAIIGGGPAGCELAQTFARLGSSVSLIQRQGRLLPKEDADVSAIVQASLERDGVRVYPHATAAAASSREERKTVRIRQPDGQQDIAADVIMAATGRMPNIENLGLDRAGVACDPRLGVAVDDFLRTSNPDIYAAGDVCSSYRFTHAADAMARIVVANALFPLRQKASALVIPRCTYTDPEIAHVGLNEQQANERHIPVLTLTVPLAKVDRAVLDGETEGFGRIHLKKGSDRILGATIVARHAGEMISELTLAITARTGLSSLGRTIHPYPTQAEVIKKLADEYTKTRLTPALKKLLAAWLRLTR